MSIYEPIQNVYGNVETPFIHYYTLTFPKNSRETKRINPKNNDKVKQSELIQGSKQGGGAVVEQPTTRFWLLRHSKVQCMTCVHTKQHSNTSFTVHQILRKYRKHVRHICKVSPSLPLGSKKKVGG